MSFLKNLFAAKTAKSNTARLGLEALDAREVPAGLNVGGNLTANVPPVDLSPVVDAQTLLFGKIEHEAGSLNPVKVTGTNGRDKVTVAALNDAVVVTLQQLDAAGNATHTQAASFGQGEVVFLEAQLGNGNDVFVGTALLNMVVRGGGGDDTISVTTGWNFLYGDAGNDLIIGGEGADSLFGGDGDDVLLGGDGADVLRGGDGNDYLDGQSGIDRVYGEAGNDKISGGRGIDLVLGGDGDDSWI